MASSTQRNSPAPYGGAGPARKVTPRRLQEMRDAGEKIVMLTAYDAVFAGLAGPAWMPYWWAIPWAWSARAATARCR